MKRINAKKASVQFCADKIEHINYKDIPQTTPLYNRERENPTSKNNRELCSTSTADYSGHKKSQEHGITAIYSRIKSSGAPSKLGA